LIIFGMIGVEIDMDKLSYKQKQRIMQAADHYSDVALTDGKAVAYQAISDDFGIPNECFCAINLLCDIYADAKRGAATRKQALERQRALWNLTTVLDDMYAHEQYVLRLDED